MPFSNKPTVLLVDDEQNNLFSFQTAFRKDAKVLTALSVTEAQKQMEENRVHVVITDQRMPESNGAEFLRWVRTHHPDVIRILMTGYEDLFPVIEAINTGHIYYYIAKPWEESQVRIWINKAFERYKSNVLLKLRNEQLQKAYNELDQLIYSASHDLRGPLTSILGLGQLIRNEPLSPNQSKYLDMVDESVTKLESILNGLSEFTKIHGLNPKHREVDLSEVVREVLQKLELVEPELKYIQLETEIVQDGPFICDEPRLEMILFNLLRNTVHFRHDGTQHPEVHIGIHANAQEAVISIQDNGIGIASEHIDHVFRLFYRGDSRSRGAGIGLYTVKESVQSMDGTLKVESETNSGTRFIITLPNRNAA